MRVSGSYNNAKVGWFAATNHPENKLGVEHMKRGGRLLFLNILLLQTSMLIACQYSNYDCVKIN